MKNNEKDNNVNKEGVFVFKNRNQKQDNKKFTVEDLLDKAGEMIEKYELPLACKFFDKALLMEPENTLVMDEYSQLLLEMGEMEKAKELLIKSIKLQPEDNHSKYMTMGQLHEGVEALKYYERGIIILQKETQKMQKERKLTKEENFNIRTELSNAYCSVAEIYLTDCCFEPNAEIECEKSIKRAIELDPKNPEALQCYANFLISKEKPEEATKFLKQSVQIWSSNEEELPPFHFRVNTCKLLIELNCHKDAIPILERLLEEDNEIPEHWYLLSLCHFDQLEECKECLDKAAKLLINSVHEEDMELLEQINQALKKVKVSLKEKNGDDGDDDKDDNEDNDDESESDDEDEDGGDNMDDEN